MAGAFGQGIRTPLVQEANATGPVAPGVGTTTSVLTGVASIHAKDITVMLTSTVALQSVSLVLYGRNKTITVTVALSGPIAAATPTVLRYGIGTNQGVGQLYDVVVANAGAAAGVFRVWTAARS